MIKKTIVVLLIISILIPTVGCQLSELKAIATVEDMHLFCVSTPAFGLSVKLKPTNAAKAGTTYIVNLYEKGKFRDSTSVLWNQPELDVIKTEIISFPLTEEEYNAYLGEDISHIFSIEIQTQSPSIKETRPHGEYSNTFLGQYYSINFINDTTLEAHFGDIIGTERYNYWILNDKGILQVKNLGTGEVENWQYSYNSKDDVVTINGVINLYK
jgi:hypothetical protein